MNGGKGNICFFPCWGNSYTCIHTIESIMTIERKYKIEWQSTLKNRGYAILGGKKRKHMKTFKNDKEFVWPL